MTSRERKRATNHHLTVTFEATVPYLYRYLTDALPNTEHGSKILKEVLDQETRLIEAKLISPIGRRFVDLRR